MKLYQKLKGMGANALVQIVNPDPGSTIPWPAAVAAIVACLAVAGNL